MLPGPIKRMNDRPVGKDVPCPECDEFASAIVPKGSEIVEEGDGFDGKVWVNCLNCGARFLVYYRTDA